MDHPGTEPGARLPPNGGWTPPGFTGSPPPPPRIPDHDLLELIGRGSYGLVWLARNRLGTLRAVKIVSREAFEDRKPFEREFKGIQRFEPVSRTHEGLVDILQVGGTDEYFYYVMELADPASNAAAVRRLEVGDRAENGGPGTEDVRRKTEHGEASSELRASSSDPRSYTPRTLRAEQQGLGRLPIVECIRIGRLLASALAHLHRHNLVHRDVKPSNIIFIEGQPKLADIGLVADVSEARSFVGTEGFIPPEGPGTPQADLYSLGKVLYEISTGLDRREFPALPDDFAQQQSVDQPNPQSPIPNPQCQIPNPKSEIKSPKSAVAFLELNAVIAKACQADPVQRYPSAEAMELDLALLERGHSVRRRRSRQQRWAVVRTAALIAGVAALAAVGLHRLGPWRGTGEGTRTANGSSISVLPFRHSAPGPARAESWELSTDVCLCGRLTDAFIDALPLIPGIRTGPRKSGWIRHDEDQVRRDLVRTNDTRYVLTGRVDHTNDTLRLVLRLYERQKEIPMWAETFVGTTNEVVALEQRAINAIARRLDQAVSEEIQRQIDRTLSNNLAAYGLFHRARSLYLLGTSPGWHQALSDFTAALDADPRYTAAMVGIMWLRGEIGFEQPPRTVQPEIYNRARQLLALDDTVFLAHTRIVYRQLYYDYDWVEALKYIDWMRSVWPEENLEQAIWMRTLGRTNEARIHHERLRQQPDPGFMELCFLAYGECVWRQYDAALAAAERLRALYPESASSPFMLGWVHLQAGNCREAIDLFRQAAGPGPGPQLLGMLGRAYALAGDRATATDLLRQLEPRVVAGEVDPYFLAWIQAGLNQWDEALANLDKAVDFKSVFIIHPDFGGLRTDPAWDGLRDDPRFEALCQEVGMGKDQWPR
jgi:serine/threonine protein kinase/TolB-like protein